MSPHHLTVIIPAPCTACLSQAMSHFPAEDSELLAAFLRWCMAAPYALQSHLHHDSGEQLQEELQVRIDLSGN